MPRANPIENLDDFSPKSSDSDKNHVQQEIIDQLARENGFPSRQATADKPKPTRVQRRYVTGRNQQINIKATSDTIDKLYKIADSLHVPLGEVLERAVSALEKQL